MIIGADSYCDGNNLVLHLAIAQNNCSEKSFKPSIMELHRLRYFVKVAETLHFTRAADELFVTQPALSQQIKILENELDTPLIDRSGKKVKLTDAGFIFLEYAKSALLEVEKGERAIADLQKAVIGNVRIGIMYSYFNPLLAIIGDFCRNYPGVKTNITLADNEALHEKLSLSELDVAMTFEDNESEELEQIGSFETRLILAVAKSHPLANLKQVSLFDLENTLLALPAEGNIIRTTLEKAFKKYKKKPFINTEINDINLLLDLVEKGDFATIVTDIAIFQRQNIVSIPIKEAFPKFKGAVLIKKNAYKSKATTLLIEAILNEMAYFRT